MTSAPAFNFRTGGNAAEAAEDENAKIARSRRGLAPEFFSINEDGGQKILRILTDDPEVILVDQHSYVPTKAAPKGVDNWPSSMTSVCRHDAAFGEVREPNGTLVRAAIFGDCYICDNKIKNRFGKTANPQIRIWALAVERELVFGDGTEALGGPAAQGTIVGIQDKIDEIEQLDGEGKPTGVTLRFPKIIVINMPVKNFWAHFRQMYGLHKTLTDRDYIVTRRGDGTSTEYEVSPIDPNGLKPGTPGWDRYTQALADRKIDLGEIVFDKASDVYYARFFNPALDVSEDGKVIAATAQPATGATGSLNIAAPAASSPQPLASNDLRDRIRNMGQPRTAEPAAEDKPPY